MKIDPKELLDDPIEGVDRPWIDWFSSVRQYGKNYTWYTKIADSHRCESVGGENVVVGKRLEVKMNYKCT